MKFHVERTFQYGGRIIREGSTIDVSKADVEKELLRGKHTKLKVWLSGLLNYCIPADDDTAAFLSEKTGVQFDVAEEESEEGNPDEITSLRASYDDIGASYDRRWGLQKLRNELLKARKVKGE